ncbi:hypothetical protein BDF20DRAFT_837024 [Mycotypha africana]|uniref:uncharacterized protein n=1 Tax=Mycotypha africana TaxID=64632 RepID=UPI0023005D4D|nr:uncharacterized protein BDF20DRAFT_837024 [Mycotypha africana]KAI8975646.1 hypothetical protein BDF20DRAFT_837024 [Mycotypha africana]
MSQGPSRPRPFTTSHNYNTAMSLAAAYTRHTQQQPSQRPRYSHNVNPSSGGSPTLSGNCSEFPGDNVIISGGSDAAIVRRGGQQASAQQESLYCDSCQTFRNVRAFNERDSKYNVCNFCRSRDMQKRKHQLERYEMFEEQQQRTIKQARYQQQQRQLQYAVPPLASSSSSPSSSTSQHFSPQLQQQQQPSSTPITLNSGEDNRPPLQTHALPPPIQTYSSSTIKNSPQLKQASNNVTDLMVRGNQVLKASSNHLVSDEISNNIFPATSSIRHLEVQQQQQQQQQQKPQVMQPAISLPLPSYQNSSFQQSQQQISMQHYMLPSSSSLTQEKPEIFNTHDASRQEQSYDDTVHFSNSKRSLPIANENNAQTSLNDPVASITPPSSATMFSSADTSVVKHSPQIPSSNSSIKSNFTLSPVTTSPSLVTDTVSRQQQQQQEQHTATLASASNRSITSAAERALQDLISLDAFVNELKKETDFDRKHYHLDISFLIDKLGDAFTQIGRAICERVLEGTKFNFSLKDRRRSTKSPNTLSTLRYYCSQRVDTAKPRKGDHPKAQCRYDCGGALTIIIDLLKQSAHVTVIHKYSHPPFVSQHGQQNQKKSEKKNQQKQLQSSSSAPSQQQAQVHHCPVPSAPESPSSQQQMATVHTQVQQHQQQQATHYKQQPQYSPAMKPLPQSLQRTYHQQQSDYSTSTSSSNSTTLIAYDLQQQQFELQRKQQHYLQKQEVEREFELLRQQVADIGELLASQQRFGNRDFLKAAKDALVGANEFLDACKAHESSNMTLQLNKYTMHYNKSEDEPSYV